MDNRKWYVVWVGTEPGICESWDECRARTEGYPGARYKAFTSQRDAILAFRRSQDDGAEMLRAIAQAPNEVVNYSAIPQLAPGSIAVDAACSGNPGHMEYQGIELDTGQQIFHKAFAPLATNNIGEFLAIVHALALMERDHISGKTIYTDSANALAWVRKRQCKTKLVRDQRTEQLYQIIERAEMWLRTHTFRVPIKKWETREWGEIPADFGRKSR